MIPGEYILKKDCSTDVAWLVAYYAPRVTKGKP